VINAIPDSPTLAITVEEVTDDDETEDDEVSSVVNLLSFQDATSTSQTDVEELSISVTYEDPDSDADIDLIDGIALTPVIGSIHYVLLTGSFDLPTYQVFTRDYGDLEDVDEEDVAELQVINASTLDPAVLTLIGSSIQTFTLSPASATSVERIDSSEDYSIELGSAGGDPVFEIEAITFAKMVRSLVVIVDQLGGGYAPLRLSEFGATTVSSDDSRPSFLRIIRPRCSRAFRWPWQGGRTLAGTGVSS